MRKLIITLLFSLTLVACSKRDCSEGKQIKCKGNECSCVDLPQDATQDTSPVELSDGATQDVCSD